MFAGSLGEEAPYALVVWVHGESFEWNAGSAYDGSVLASLGRVIVVTLNYRLGVLGEYKASINGKHYTTNLVVSARIL